jgi:hypothetical protein
VFDAQRAAGDGVQGGAIAGAVVAHYALNGDAVAGVERDSSSQEADGGGGFLVGEDLDVGQAGGVVDADVHELPADRFLALLARAALQTPVAVNAMAGAAGRDPAEFLDVDVQQLARVAALVAVGRLRRLKAAELAQADAQQDRRDRRQRHRQTERDLRAGHAQLAQQHDHLDEVVGRAMRDRLGCRGAILQAPIALGQVARHPLLTGALANAGGLGRRRQRPTVVDDAQHHDPPTLRAERRVSVNLHPVSSSD